MDNLLATSHLWKIASTVNSLRLKVREMNFSSSSLWFANNHGRSVVSTVTWAARQRASQRLDTHYTDTALCWHSGVQSDSGVRYVQTKKIMSINKIISYTDFVLEKLIVAHLFTKSALLWNSNIISRAYMSPSLDSESPESTLTYLFTIKFNIIFPIYA